jgi:hypothetical protein
MVAEGLRAAKDQLERGVDSLQDVQSSSATRGVEELRSRLDEVTRQIALAFETLAGRDRAIVDAVQRRVREHGELVSTETAAITKAMEAYVQQGVSAMGQLASDVEAQIAKWDESAEARLAQAAEDQVRLFDERIRSIAERATVDTTTLNEALTHLLDTSEERHRSVVELLELMHDRVGMESRDVVAAIEGSGARTAERLGELPGEIAELARTVEERMATVSEDLRSALDERIGRQLAQTIETRTMGLAELIRADTSALRDELVRTAAAQDETIANVLDERLGRISEGLTTATGWMVEEISRRLRDDAVLAIRTRMDEAVSTIERHGDETARMLNGRMDDAVLTIDRNMVRMSDTLEGQVERLTRTVGDRVEGSIGQALDARIASITRTLDGHITSLAKLIRSDNESLGQQIMADQEASKQALRAMKELQASLPADVVETIQQRMDDLAESVAKSQEMLAQRIDRMAAKIGERYDNDIQVVIDRMGDAMHAIAGLGRAPQGNVGASRIELE